MKNDFHPVFLRYCPWLPDPLPWVAMGTYQVCSAYIQNNECLLKKARKGRRLLLRSPDLSAASARVALSTHLGLRFLLVKGPFPPQVGIDFCFSGGDALMIAGLFFKGKGWLVLLTRSEPTGFFFSPTSQLSLVQQGHFKYHLQCRKDLLLEFHPPLLNTIGRGYDSITGWTSLALPISRSRFTPTLLMEHTVQGKISYILFQTSADSLLQLQDSVPSRRKGHHLLIVFRVHPRSYRT